MLDAYVGTIDYEGEDFDDALEEVRSFLTNARSRLDRSFVVEDDGEIVSAVLVSVGEDGPFIGYVMTLPSHKGRGLARHVLHHALSHLAADGYARVVAYITDGNVASEGLFHSIGAVRVPSG